MLYTKVQWLKDFRDYAGTIFPSIKTSMESKRDKVTKINKLIKMDCDKKLAIIKKLAVFENWDKERLLHEILCMTYASYIVILECRNKIWPYEYMAFARCVGELWEPFCKLVFKYSLKELHFINTPSFEQVQ